jgi:hypothetical protein
MVDSSQPYAPVTLPQGKWPKYSLNRRLGVARASLNNLKKRKISPNKVSAILLSISTNIKM